MKYYITVVLASIIIGLLSKEIYEYLTWPKSPTKREIILSEQKAKTDAIEMQMRLQKFADTVKWKEYYSALLENHKSQKTGLLVVDSSVVYVLQRKLDSLIEIETE